MRFKKRSKPFQYSHFLFYQCVNSNILLWIGSEKLYHNNVPDYNLSPFYKNNKALSVLCEILPTIIILNKQLIKRWKSDYTSTDGLASCCPTDWTELIIYGFLFMFFEEYRHIPKSFRSKELWLFVCSSTFLCCFIVSDACYHRRLMRLCKSPENELLQFFVLMAVNAAYKSVHSNHCCFSLTVSGCIAESNIWSLMKATYEVWSNSFCRSHNLSLADHEH